MKGKYAQKNFGAVGAMAPTPLSLKTRGGGGGLGGVAYKDWARPPPRAFTNTVNTKQHTTQFTTQHTTQQRHKKGITVCMQEPKQAWNTTRKTGGCTRHTIHRQLKKLHNPQYFRGHCKPQYRVGDFGGLKRAGGPLRFMPPEVGLGGLSSPGPGSRGAGRGLMIRVELDGLKSPASSRLPMANTGIGATTPPPALGFKGDTL